MKTTTIRVDTSTHARLLKLSRDADTSLVATVRDAAEALWRQRFAREVTKQINELRQDPEAWQEYLAEAEEIHVTDGIG